MTKFNLASFASTLWSTARRYFVEGQGLEDQKVCNFEGCYLIIDSTVNVILCNCEFLYREVTATFSCKNKWCDQTNKRVSYKLATVVVTNPLVLTLCSNLCTNLRTAGATLPRVLISCIECNLSFMTSCIFFLCLFSTNHFREFKSL